MRVLLAEDHAKLAITVARGLRREGMAVDVVFDGQDALTHAADTDYDVVVLDRDLPRVHGDDVCRMLVADGRRARILMLTAARSISDRVQGLGLGADDYLPKPFAFANRAPSNMTFLEHTVNGQPGLVAQQDGITVTVFAFDIAGDRITHIWAILDFRSYAATAARAS